MVICLRCQRNIAQFECEICNAVYCSECDKFIHSNKPKINHKRNEIQIYEQNENPRIISKISLTPNLIYSNKLNDLNNLAQSQSQGQIQNKTENYLLDSNSNININKNNYSLYQENIEKNNKTITIPNEIEQQENKYRLLSEVYQLPSSNILKNIDTVESIENKVISKNFEEEKEIKNSSDNNKSNKFNNQKQNLNNCILNENNYYENNKKKNIINEKDEEIKELQKRIEEQREIINKLKLENNNLEELIEKDRLKKDELYKEKERLYNRKRKIEEFYTEKQDEIQKIHDLEKYRLIEEYENQMREISDNYINKKSEFIQGIKEIEDKMREYEINREEEKKNMFDEIDRLKKEGINADKEQEYLLKSNDELNNKLRETTSNMDLLRASALMSTVPKMKSLLKNKKKKKGY